MNNQQISIPRKLYPKVGDYHYIQGIFHSVEILEIYRIGNRTFFMFQVDGIERNAVIDLKHYKEHGNVMLTDVTE